jgi:hypothetical protein
MGVGSLKAAEVSTITDCGAGHEKAHRICGWLPTRLLRGQHRAGRDGGGGGKNKNTSLHLGLLVKSRRNVRRQVVKLMVLA